MTIFTFILAISYFRIRFHIGNFICSKFLSLGVRQCDCVKQTARKLSRDDDGDDHDHDDDDDGDHDDDGEDEDLC